MSNCSSLIAWQLWLLGLGNACAAFFFQKLLDGSLLEEMVLTLFSFFISLREPQQGRVGQHSLAWHISFIKSLAEFSRIPVVVTNQVRSLSGSETPQYSFQVQKASKVLEYPASDSHLVAALGIHWAHAVSVRLVFESRSGLRFIKLAKSSISPPMAFPFNITSAGISLLDDNGVEIRGPEVNKIHFEGYHGIINFDDNTSS